MWGRDRVYRSPRCPVISLLQAGHVGAGLQAVVARWGSGSEDTAAAGRVPVPPLRPGPGPWPRVPLPWHAGSERFLAIVWTRIRRLGEWVPHVQVLTWRRGPWHGRGTGSVRTAAAPGPPASACPEVTSTGSVFGWLRASRAAGAHRWAGPHAVERAGASRTASPGSTCRTNGARSLFPGAEGVAGVRSGRDCVSHGCVRPDAPPQPGTLGHSKASQEQPSRQDGGGGGAVQRPCGVSACRRPPRSSQAY